MTDASRDAVTSPPMGKPVLSATHLVKNAFGGSRRGLFCGVMSTYPPISRYVRDDITVQVVFFGDLKRELDASGHTAG